MSSEGLFAKSESCGNHDGKKTACDEFKSHMDVSRRGDLVKISITSEDDRELTILRNQWDGSMIFLAVDIGALHNKADTAETLLQRRESSHTPNASAKEVAGHVWGYGNAGHEYDGIWMKWRKGQVISKKINISKAMNVLHRWEAGSSNIYGNPWKEAMKDSEVNPRAGEEWEIVVNSIVVAQECPMKQFALGGFGAVITFPEF